MKENFNRLFNWVKENKLTTVIILVVLYFLFYRRPVLLPQLLGSRPASKSGYGNVALEVADSYAPGARVGTTSYYPEPNVAPQPDVTDRRVITKSSMSLQVRDVRDTIESIKAKTRELGGYVVETNVSTPEFGEDGSIVVRVPADSLDSTLEYFRGLSIKVVSENISGTDITDQYVDIQERINRLENTKARFEEILASAETVEEILKVQREIFNLQDQIDNYKGRLEYMEAASDTTLIRIYLSTDELGLPYTPSQAWRPQVVFKQATRSLLTTLIGVGNAAIWIAVYVPLIAAGVLIFWVVKKLLKKRQ